MLQRGYSRRMNRRGFLGGVSAGLATSAVACKSGSSTVSEMVPPVTPTGESSPGDGGLTEDIIAAAEKVARVVYTPAERKQLLGAVGEFHQQIAKRREASLDFDAAPALTFDPQPPGQPVPSGSVRVRLPATREPLPSSDDDIAFATLPQLAGWLRRKVLSSARLTRIYQRRLRLHAPALECVVTETPELAARQAARADAEIAAGRYRGPLHGIPYGAKDLLDTAGLATTFGAKPYAGRIATRDATVVKRLEEAGAVLLAKTTLGALAYGDRWFGGTTRNPWNRAEGSSGSSAGSAAGTAAGLFGFSLGTETLGSILSPCARCGTTGLRPTFGRVPRGGAMPLAWSMDKIGPICRSVAGTAMVLTELAGADADDPASRTARFDADLRAPSLAGLRVGVADGWVDGDADKRALASIEAAGATLVKVDLSSLPGDALFPILLAESAAAFESLTLDGRDDELVRQDDHGWPNTFRAARFISAVDLIQADRLRRVAMTQVATAFSNVDILASSSRSALLVPLNFTGHPALTLRAGFVTRAPRPLDGGKPDPTSTPFEAPESLVLYGKLWDEGTLCRAGAALEARLGVAGRRPPIG